MSNVITLNPPLARPVSADLGRGAAATMGLLHALAKLVGRGRDAAELRGWNDRALRDIGLARRDLGRHAVSCAWDAGTGTWTPRRGGH